MTETNKYSNEVEQCIIDNYLIMPYSLLVKKLKFDVKLTTLKAKIKRMMKSRNLEYKKKRVPTICYTEKMNQFIIDNYNNVTIKELCIMFKEEFNINISTAAMTKKIQRFSEKNMVTNKHIYHKYTEEQDEWLKQNVDNYSYTTMEKMFNNKFNTNINAPSLQRRCVEVLKINTLKRYQKKFCETHSAPIGYETYNDGYIYVKIKDKIKGKKNNWKAKHRYVWENHYGAIPKGYRIVFSDNNPMNCDISNLDCVSPNIQAGLSHFPYNNSLRRCKIASMKLDKILEELN